MVKMTGGQALMKSLYQEGVRVIFGLPGVQLYHALDALYEQPESLAEKLPLLKTLTTPASELEQRAQEIVAVMTALLPEFNVEMVSSRCQLGSGSLPDQTIDSRAVRIDHDDPKSIRQLGERLRSLNTPVIGRIHDDALHLDMRGAERLEALCSTLKALVPST